MDEVAIFTTALEQESAGQQAAYLDATCAGQVELRRKVEDLLRAHVRAGNFLDQAAADCNARLPIGDEQRLDERPGTVIGPYKLLEQIGEGGMGLVFMADQLQPVRRRVALKVLKPGMDTRQVVARFEAERQALALMDHPHIAQVFDGGTTPAGRPYFVMELVKGVPITTFCDQRRLRTRQRLELFTAVCQAVQHAHQKGVIHRDLKPSNVLVTLHDTVAVPKIIDFGIAKAIHLPLTERTLFTNFAQTLGTPLYMSPEQAEMNGLDVDTRSDVYALGVLLYELLTGTTPFEDDTLKKVGLDEMRRRIREEEPQAPSQRMNTLKVELCSTVSEQRGVEVRRLRQLLRGELDWIVMKALEKDRTRRYESASAFAADVQRYLNDEPVEACPASAGYRLRKFARRNRRILITAGIFASVLTAATVVSAWQAVTARDAQHQAEADRKQAEADRKQAEADRDRAKTAEQQAKTDQDRAKTAERRAASEAAIARAVNDFLQQDVLGQVNTLPQGFDGPGWIPNLTVREALDRAAAHIGERFRDQPLVEAAIRTTIGEAYSRLYAYQLAVDQFERAVALRQANLGYDHPDTLTCMRRLAGLYAWVGRTRDAVRLLEEVVENHEKMFGSDHSTTLDSKAELSSACAYAGLYDRAIVLAKHVFEKRKATLGPTNENTIRAMHSIAGIYLSQADHLPESLEWHEKTLAICRSALGRDSDTTQYVMRTYSRALQKAGKLDEADALVREVLELLRNRKTRDRQIAIANTQTILVLNLLLQERYAEAETVAREAVLVMEKETPDSWARFNAMSQLGAALLGQEKYADAEPFLVQGYEGMKQREAMMDCGFKYYRIGACEQVVRFYEATEQPEKARAWREKLREEKGDK